MSLSYDVGVPVIVQCFCTAFGAQFERVKVLNFEKLAAPCSLFLTKIPSYVDLVLFLILMCVIINCCLKSHQMQDLPIPSVCRVAEFEPAN